MIMTFRLIWSTLPIIVFLNNYFKLGFKAWEANMKIEPLFNEQKAIAYLRASISKSKNNCSSAMKRGLKTSIENKCSNNE